MTNTTPKKVIVTGASRGIGKAIALQLATAGFDIVAHYCNDEAKANATVNQIKKAGGSVQSMQFDLLEREQIEKKLKISIEESGPFYGAVCNAGLTIDGLFPTTSAEKWDRVVHSNLDGLYNVLHPIIMPMVSARQGGRIVTISSTSGIVGNPGQVSYSAAKAGIIGATKSLAVELAKRDITVNCVAPGFIETDMTEKISEDMIKNNVPLRRFGQVEEVASLVGYLFSDAAAYITRQVIAVNGGLH